MGTYFGTDGFRGEAEITLTADHAYKVGRFLAGITTLFVSVTAILTPLVLSLARIPAAARICSSIAWLLV